ncbi:MAG: WGR domain-containing protein [Cyanobacteria bacterium J06639_14]
MTKLLILLSDILTQTGAEQALEKYKQDGFAITLCETLPQGGSVEEALSTYIKQMTTTAQLAQLILSDHSGAFAYSLKQSGNSFPNLRRLRSKKPLGNQLTDDSEFWETVDVESFAGRVDFLLQEYQPTHTVVICNQSVDETSVANISLIQHGAMQYQTTEHWLQGLSPKPIQSNTQNTPNIAEAARRFEYVNLTENSQKFWLIGMNPDSLGFWTNFGRIGTNGRCSPVQKTFATPAVARQQYLAQIKAKLRKGYIEV